ncbi:MAG: excinuclease ABC subunit UvrC, partial [Pseudomonadales bacterium]
MSDADQAAFDSNSFLKTLTRRPGVYQMLDTGGVVIYVGKAKNLKNRVASYFRARGLNSKTVALVSKIHSVQITVTNSETEALILEQSLIKSHKPHYNILFRDDKSYPYIYLSSQHEYPRLGFHRGARKAKGDYYGPYPSAGSVRDSLSLLQKIFPVRQCEDSYFKNRTRPCLQYQIGRCSGPCVGRVSDEDYAESVRYTQMFLDGRDQQLVAELADKMEHAAEHLEFEHAARLRDQIGDLRRVQETQFVEGRRGDIDVLAAAQSSGLACVHRLFIRSGRILGSRSYFPKPKLEETSAEVLHSFISQFYVGAGTQDMPREIIISESIPEQDLLREALQVLAGRKVALSSTVRRARAAWVKLATQAALQNLEARLANKQSIAQRFEALQDALQMSELPQRIECFDISHSSGEAPVASCVVFDTGGARKTDYRRFNIKGIIGGDDYAAM